MTHRELLEIVEEAQKRNGAKFGNTMGAFVYDDPLRAIAEVIRERLGDEPKEAA